MKNGLNINKYIFFIILFFVLILKPLSVLLILLFILPGVLILNKPSIPLFPIYSTNFYFLNILISNIFNFKLRTTILLMSVQFLIMIVLFYKNAFKFLKLNFNFKLLNIFLLIILFMCFFKTYFNFSDSAYHLSFLNKILSNNKFLNSDPFYGENFYDIRYSFSLFIPFLSLFLFSIKNLFINNIEAVKTLWNSTHILIYFLSLVSIYSVSKKEFGKKTAEISLFLFSIFFLFIKSNLYNGFGFSLSNYPFSLSVYVFSFLTIYVLRRKLKKEIFLISFINSGIHIFYWGLYLIFFITEIIYTFIKEKRVKLELLLIYLVGGVPVILFKFINNPKILNAFFKDSVLIDRLFNLKYFGIGIPGFLPIISLLCMILCYKIFKKRYYFPIVGILLVLISLISPELSKVIKINSHKFKRIYQVFPVVFLMPPIFIFMKRKFKKTIIVLCILTFISGFYFVYSKKNISTLNSIPHNVIKIIKNLPNKSLILSDANTSMLIPCFSNNDIVYVHKQFTAPSVNNIKQRANAFDNFLLTGENSFNADYCLIAPNKRKKLNTKLKLLELGGGFCLIKLKELK
jgi:hypothetical protein